MRMLTKVRKKHTKEVERKEKLLKIRLRQLKLQKISISRFAKKMMFVNTIYIVCKTLMLYSSSWILQKNLINLMEKEKYMGMDLEKFPSMEKAVYFPLGTENVLKTVIHTTKRKF